MVKGGFIYTFYVLTLFIKIIVSTIIKFLRNYSSLVILRFDSFELKLTVKDEQDNDFEIISCTACN